MRNVIGWKTHSLTKPIFSLVCVLDKADEVELTKLASQAILRVDVS